MCNESGGAPHEQPMSDKVAPTAVVPPDGPNKWPCAVRPLNLDNPNYAAFMLVSIISMLIVFQKSKKYSNSHDTPSFTSAITIYSIFIRFNSSSTHTGEQATEYSVPVNVALASTKANCSASGLYQRVTRWKERQQAASLKPPPVLPPIPPPINYITAASPAILSISAMTAPSSLDRFSICLLLGK